ncbi:MAG: NmrA family NAD(P)-binding protein [Edaphobacter sp.]
MKILVTGGTGNVGRAVVQELLKRGAEVRVLTRKQPAAGKLPASVEVAIGDMLDPVSIEQAMNGADKLFLLNAIVADELTQALIAYGIAKRIGLKHVTYLSVFKADRFRDVPHFASKVAVENALREFGVPFTILRPGYFFQNDVALKDALHGPGVYPMPLGTAGICAVDIRDIAEAAAASLTEDGHDGKTYDLVGPSMITGPGNAAIWSRLLGREIKYTGHNFDQWEQQMRARVAGWTAFDLRTMFQGFFDRGFTSTETEVARITTLLGHAPRSYENFATETATLWKAQTSAK